MVQVGELEGLENMLSSPVEMGGGGKIRLEMDGGTVGSELPASTPVTK